MRYFSQHVDFLSHNFDLVNKDDLKSQNYEENVKIKR